MAGVKSPHRRNQLSPEQLRRMREARAQGVSVTDLAKRFGVNKVKASVMLRGVVAPKITAKIEGEWW